MREEAMARTRGYTDLELEALLARSTTSIEPQQQRPPRAPPSASARRQTPPATTAEVPGESPAVSPPRTAPPPCMKATLNQACGGGHPIPPAPASRHRVHAPPPLQHHKAVLQPRNRAEVEVPRAQQRAAGGHAAAGRDKNQEDKGGMPRVLGNSDQELARLLARSTTAREDSRCLQRPPRAPSSARRQPKIAEDPGEKPVETPTVPSPRTAPPPSVAATLEAACGGGPPIPPAPASRRRVHAPPPLQQHKEVSSAAVLQPWNHADVVEAGAQQPAPHAVVVGHSPTGRDKNWEEYEIALRTRKSSLQNASQSVMGCHVSNPVDHEIADSIAAFATNKPNELEIIRDALMVLPKGPRSLLHNDQSSGGGDCGSNGTSAKSLEVSFDVGPQLTRYGFVGSEPWSTIWRQEPLILHDADIVRAAKGIAGQVDVMQAITSTLQNHPGPVKYFRVDSSQIPKGREQLEEWFALLKKKGVEEIVIVNTRWPYDMMELPINDLDCESVRQLRLCFFRISDVVLTYVNNLTAIDLCYCSISTQDLCALIDQSKNLKELDIGYYEGDAIRICSKSLEILLIWQSTVKKVSVKSASKLRRIFITARPKRSYVEVWIKGAPKLTDVLLNLSTQSITINDISLKKDNTPLPSLRRLALNISLLVKKERITLLNLMRSCMVLKELTIWRSDAASDEEYFDAIYDDWPAKFNNLSCMKLHMEVFNMKDFRGGYSEIALASAVLEQACCLKELNLEGDLNCTDDAVFDRAKLNLQTVVQASASAVVNYVMGLSDGDRFFFEGI